MSGVYPEAPLSSPAPAPEEVPVRLVRLWLCDPCLDGAGGECHTPGCAMWINRAPDIPLRDSPMVTILADPAPEVWDASVPPGGYVCSACGIPVESEPCPDHGVPAPEAATPDPVAATVSALIGLAHDRYATARLARGQRSYERMYQLDGEAIGLAEAAREVRERLAPAWDALAGRLAGAEAGRDKAYRERAALVAYLAATYPSVITDAPDVGDVPGSGAGWDGHTTEQKYERLEELTRTTALGGAPDAG